MGETVRCRGRGNSKIGATQFSQIHFLFVSVDFFSSFLTNLSNIHSSIQLHVNCWDKAKWEPSHYVTM